MTSVPLKIKKLYPDAQLPVKGSEKAACFDFFVHRIERDGFNKAILYFGLACEFPDDYVLTLQPRSSFSNRGWEMANSPGQVDADYRGELQMRVQAIPTDALKMGEDLMLGYMDLPFKEGDRCCQGKLEQVIPVSIEETSELSDTNRGVGGFGSTGN